MPTPIAPRLLADIGGTYARFALEREPGVYSDRQNLRCADYPDFLAALKAYLGAVDSRDVRLGAIAIANPVEGDEVRMTNYPWQFSIEATRRAVGFDTLLVVNDFTALAMGLPHLEPGQVRQVGGGQARERSVIGLLGAGTGLGVSGLIPVEDGWVSLATEGGHVAFAPQTPRELSVLEYAWRQYAHVSAERLISASGIELIYRALAARADRTPEPLAAPEITRRALAGSDALAVESIAMFCEMLGTVAANLALTLGAYGGLYIGGGIVPRLGEYFDRSGFRARFEAKGRFSALVANIPTFVITSDTDTLSGASAILDAQLRRQSGGSSLLERVRQMRASLSGAEQRVADWVLAQPRSALSDPIVDIARQAGVSQPTVVRFCRSMGCAGLSDFKLKLASGLTSTIPVSHTQVKRTDSTHELGAKVLDNTAAAVLKARDEINADAVQRAIDMLLAARRVDFHAVGQYGIVATDAQYKFLRFGVPTAAYTDPRVQQLAAGVLGPGDVLVVISGSGKVQELQDSVDTALERGARVIALTPSHAPLAKRATLAITIDHAEDVTTQMPMISRILHLAVIDVLAVGVAMRRSGAAPQAAVGAPSAGARSARPVPGEVPDYARLTSHAR
ncbi:glucokinase [Caldimonas sp. KR1-144]|uniref:glucokinase n=1 Tax=Caldimonas sp. KR1-144 TaxID=3400911 RepID=UPI003BFEB34A